METPSRHTFNLDGSNRVFPIPSPIKGDNYCRLEIDSVVVNDRAKYDIVNNSIVFLNIADVPSGSVLDVLVVQSEESLGQLTITTNIDIVADDIANVNIVGINIADVNTVAGNTADIDIVSANTTNINTVAGIDANVTTVAGIAPNVTTVAGNTTNVNTVAGNTTNINTVAGINADVTTVAGISANVTSVVANETNINTVAADGTDIGLVGGSIASVNTTATNIASVNTNATNIADINTNATNIVDIQNAEENAASALASKNAAAISETNSETSNVASEAARAASVVAKNAAETAETNAATSETNAATSEANAAASETNAAASEATATTGAATATAQAVIATNQAVAAAASAASITDEEANAAASAAASASSATDSANSAAAAASALDNFDDRYLGPKSSEPTLDNDGDALVSGALYFATTSNAMQVYDGANWIAASAAGVASMNLYEYTATAGQTTFTGADDNNNSISFIQGNEIVVLNGIILDPSDYNSTSGTSIVLGVGAAVGDLLNVYAFKSFTVADTVSASTGGTFGGDVTVTGTLAATTLTGDGSAITGLPAGYTDTDVATYLAGVGNVVVGGTVDGVDIAARDATLTSTTTTANAALPKAGGTMTGVIAGFESTGIDDNATSTAMTLDSSGNLLVGTTTPFVGGVTLSPLGVVQAERNNVSGVFNRTSTDGDIVQFRKDGSTVGSIGTFGGAIYISSPDGTDAGLRIGNGYFAPVTTTGALRDNAIDVGTPSARFKDGYFSNTVNAANFNTTSDATLKTNVETLSGSLDAVKSLRGVSFDWLNNGGSEIGVIAQEVEAVLPDVVSTNDEGIKSVKYGNMVAVLIEAIKEQQAQIDELKAQLNS